MTHFNTAFSASSKSDSAFDDLTASLGDARPHPTEDALIQLGRALMTELVDVISDTALEDYQTILGEALIGAFHSAAGRIERDAVDIAPEERRRLFAYAAQDVRLLNGSVRENLLLAGPADEAALWAALDDAALGDRLRAEPLGLDTPVGPNGERLSGGERRRLGLARAYLRDAPWLVLDEPTEGLDTTTEAQVLDRLQNRLAALGQGLILVSHRAPPMALCDRSIRVEGLDSDGHLRLTCPPDDLAA